MKSWINLSELAAVPPAEDGVDSTGQCRRPGEVESNRLEPAELSQRASSHSDDIVTSKRLSTTATQLYTHSYLIFFAMLGTLARKGLTTLTTYPGTPVAFDTIWPNFAGCFIMGFLLEDRKLFLHEWGSPTYHQTLMEARQQRNNAEHGRQTEQDNVDLSAARAAFMTTKKSIPLYIGLTTGFCGSLTTFSEFILDVFLSMANHPASLAPPTEPTSRNGGYGFMALLAVIIVTVCLSLSAIRLGVDFAVGMESLTPPLPITITRKVLDRSVVVLGWGSWVGVIILCILSPHNVWRGHIALSLAFAPLGVILRFHLAILLNSKISTFPLGTFLANVFASAIVAAVWAMDHASVGGIIACEVLQGVEGGFCGCLSTVSTWAAELNSLRRKYSYFYGMLSILVSLVLVVIIAGVQNWAVGIQPLLC